MEALAFKLSLGLSAFAYIWLKIPSFTFDFWVFLETNLFFQILILLNLSAEIVQSSNLSKNNFEKIQVNSLYKNY